MNLNTTDQAHSVEALKLRLLLAAWIIALTATLAALFIGEVMGQTPCLLCWHQRVFMFPLALVLGVACYRSEPGVWPYALPLAVVGGLIAAYHCLVYFGIVDETLVPCSQSGPSCASSDMTILGGLPIPLLSLAAFTTIAAALALIARRPT